MATYERAWESAPTPQAVWRPVGTYALLITMGIVWLAQHVVLSAIGAYEHAWVFLIGPDWYLRPWTLITSTMAHATGSIGHILLNGLMLFFFGPALERILGLKRFLFGFFVAGAISGIIQVTISQGLALGASGAIMFVFGALVMIMPKHTILVWGILPAPFWAVGVFYVAADLLGALGPANGIGNFAHLAGIAIGLVVGYRIKQRVRPVF